MAKILALDIETRPALAYTWKLFDANIGVDQIVDNGGILCVSAQWVGDKKMQFFSEWSDGKEGMLKAIHKLMTEADAILTYNGISFDQAKLQGEFLLYGLPPCPPLTSIDLYKVIKKFGFISGKLAFVGPLLGVGSKVKHEGFGLWRSVMDGDPAARRRMARYCMQDVRLLIDLYERVKAFVPNHPHLGDNKQECAQCGSSHVQLRGFRRTKFFKTQRLQCQECGSWSTGKRTGIK